MKFSEKLHSIFERHGFALQKKGHSTNNVELFQVNEDLTVLNYNSNSEEFTLKILKLKSKDCAVHIISEGIGKEVFYCRLCEDADEDVIEKQLKSFFDDFSYDKPKELKTVLSPSALAASPVRNSITSQKAFNSPNYGSSDLNPTFVGSVPTNQPHSGGMLMGPEYFENFRPSAHYSTGSSPRINLPEGSVPSNARFDPIYPSFIDDGAVGNSSPAGPNPDHLRLPSFREGERAPFRYV
jgi:hypothetical protein